METTIKIKFLKINGQKVNEDMISKRFKKATKITVKKLCETIKKYFLDYNILVSVENETRFE